MTDARLLRLGEKRAEVLTFTGRTYRCHVSPDRFAHGSGYDDVAFRAV